MKQLPIRNIIREQYNAIQEIAVKVLVHFNESDIHSFRVSVKKLKCLLLLAGMHAKNIKIYKLPKRIRKLYIATGHIRNLQLVQHLEIPALSDSFNSFCKKNIRDNIKLSKKIASGIKPFEQGAKKSLHMIPVTLNTPAITRFSDYEVNKLKKLMQSPYTKDSVLHNARKVLKNLLYEWNYLPAERPDSKNIQRINKLAVLLGRFQDNCTRLRLLQKHNGTLHSSETQKIHLAKEKDRDTLHQLLTAMTA